jgi:hypothetical protein
LKSGHGDGRSRDQHTGNGKAVSSALATLRFTLNVAYLLILIGVAIGLSAAAVWFLVHRGGVLSFVAAIGLFCSWRSIKTCFRIIANCDLTDITVYIAQYTRSFALNEVPRESGCQAYVLSPLVTH